MTTPSATNLQPRAEDADWDRLVLGPYFDLYQLLIGEHSGLEPGGDVSVVIKQVDRAIPSAPAGLSPIAQVLLANAFTATMLRAASPVGGPNSGAASTLRSLRRFDFVRFNPLLSAAVDRIYGTDQISFPWLNNEPGQAWASLGSLHLTSLASQFDDSVSTLLHYAAAAGRLVRMRRHTLNPLLFHPLQNAREHGQLSKAERSFGGVAARVVARQDPETPSFVIYRQALGAQFADNRGAFLEVTVHDNGVGIASHFHEAKRNPGEPELSARDPAVEWTTLVGAFERHQTSKPVSFRRITTQVGSTPGVGLAGFLSALKQSHAYMELRTGRLRVFQWYREGERIDQRLLLQPSVPPAAGVRVIGTIFRILIPLSDTSAQSPTDDASGDEAEA